MGEFGISGLIKEGELEKLEQLDLKLIKIKSSYIDVAKELAKGMKMDIETPKDLDKLLSVYSTQVTTAEKTNTELNVTLEKQKKVLLDVADNLQKQTAAGNLTTKEMKQLSDVNAKNAAALEKVARAELSVTKAQNSGKVSNKNAIVTEEERNRIISEAIKLTNRQVHSIKEAEVVNKQLRQAVKLVRDTDADYMAILGRLNSTIGVNTDYVKRNSDRYTQQKMTIGAYREEMKAAWVEIRNGNDAFKNIGIVAKGFGGVLRNSVSPEVNKIGVGMKTLISGYVGAQAVINGVVKLFTKLREGVGDVVEFEFATSRLAAILGTTSDKINELTLDAKRLGATTKYTASEAAELQIELAKLGFTRKEILDSTEAILRFAQATGAQLSEAASLSGAALRMFNANTRETERYVSAMAIATTKSALSFSYLATAMPIVGPVAKAFNFTIEDTLALLGKLADSGFDASMAATATRNVFLNLADSGGKLATALGGPVKTLPDLVVGLKKLKEQGIDLNTTLELTDKRSVAAFNAFLTAADKIVPLREQITGVDEELANMAGTMANNVKGEIASLGSAWESFMITLLKNTGALAGTIGEITTLIRSMREAIATEEELAKERLANATRIGQQAAKQDKEWVKSKLESIETVAFHYRKEGVDGTEAFEKARAEQLKILERTLGQEEARLQLYTKRNIKEWEEYNNRSFWKQGLGLQQSTSKMKEDINDSFSLIENQTSYISSLKEKIEQIIGLTNEYKQDDSSISTVKILTEKEKRELEKAAAERLKIQQTYQDSILALMDEGLEKELKRIGLDYSKKIAAVKGFSKEEIATRKNLAKEMQDAIEKYKNQYNANREKQDITSALEVVQKGSKEELAMKLRLLDIQREAEINAAKKTGEDIFIIDEKYLKKRQLLFEENASYQIQLIAENAAEEQVIRDQQYQIEMLSLKKKLTQKHITQKEYAEQEFQLTSDYVRKTNEAAIDALELELQAENLSADDRAKISKELQKLKAELAQKEAEAEISAIEMVSKADEKAHKEKIRSLQNWLQTSQQAIGSISDLIANVYDGQITKIEDEQNANDVAYDRAIERIESQAEAGVLSEEQAETRKRAAKEKTEVKNRELEKKKQELARKQAIWDKATSIAQAGIATALAITKALPNFILAAIVGAMGAIQVATIAATPIPAYAEGTKDGSHPGGKALVGDGGKHEVVVHNRHAWITPDSPMLVDLPKGAQVFPDVNEFGHIDWQNDGSVPMFSFLLNSSKPGNTTIYNDYSGLERRMDMTNHLLIQSMKQRHKEKYFKDFELYKLSKL